MDTESKLDLYLKRWLLSTLEELTNDGLIKKWGETFVFVRSDAGKHDVKITVYDIVSPNTQKHQVELKRKWYSIGEDLSKRLDAISLSVDYDEQERTFHLYMSRCNGGVA